MTKDDKDFFSPFLNKEAKEPSPSKQEPPSNGHNASSLSVYYNELFGRIKASLSAMQAFAFLSRENFKDQELGEDFYRIVNEDIEKTISLLSCFKDYINFSTPVIKRNTVNIIVEEMIKKHENEFEERKIRIIKKQLEKDLPETILPDDQLRYILNSVILCTLLSTSPEGSIGFLTRSFDLETAKGEELSQLQKEGKYLEILVVSAGDEETDEQREATSGISTHPEQEKATELILKLAKEIISKNRGVMRYKVYDNKPMTFISMVLPVERRNIIHYPSPEDRPKKETGIEK